jgi:hypothetical protein
MVAEAFSTKPVGLRLGLRVFVGPGLLAIVPGCLVTTGPATGSVSDASMAAEADPAPASGGSPEAATMTSSDPQGCPATRPASCSGAAAACTQVGANCVYNDWCCTCGDGMMQWYCAHTDAPDPCPKDAPDAGSRCSLDAVGCMYCTPKGLFTAACGPDKTITYYAPQCEATIMPPPVVVDAGSHGAPPAADAGAPPADDGATAD